MWSLHLIFFFFKIVFLGAFYLYSIERTEVRQRGDDMQQKDESNLGCCSKTGGHALSG